MTNDTAKLQDDLDHAVTQQLCELFTTFCGQLVSSPNRAVGDFTTGFNILLKAQDAARKVIGT
jgi:hypothetical protein